MTIKDPKVGRFTERRFEGLRVPNLLQELALGVVLGITRIGNIVLVDDGVGVLDNVEGVQSDCSLLAVGVEVYRALREHGRDGELRIM